MMEQLHIALGTQSRAQSNQAGVGSQTKNYEAGSMSLSFEKGSVRVIQNQEAWDSIEARFRNTKDKSGNSMADVCKTYWDKKRRGE